MTTTDYPEAVETARSYYNSDDADRFYQLVWGGEDIHVGVYDSPDESIRDASRRTVEHMVHRIGAVNESDRVLDLGAGYGGSARFLAGRFGCHVVALNLSEVENQRNRALNQQQGLDHLIEVIDGSFEDLPFENSTFDVVWSQDAILHSGNRPRVLREAARVLKVGGSIVLTDPMQADDCPEGELQPIYDRIHLESLASPAFYARQAASLGLIDDGFDDLTPCLTMHYSRVLDELQAREEELISAGVSSEYIERMKQGLNHWIQGGKRGFLAWGIFHFLKSQS